MDYLEAFSGFSVGDLNLARKFYKENLGLDVRNNSMGFLELHISGNRPVVSILSLIISLHPSPSITL